MQLGAIVLSGGRSRRMGRPKEALPFGRTTLLGRTVDTMLAHTWPVVVVARDAEQDLPPFELEAELVHDAMPGQGPLSGLLAGLRALEGRCDAALCCGCDQPWLDGRTIAWLASQLGDHDLVMPRVDGVLQPLAAIYRVELAGAAARLLADGVHAPRHLVERATDPLVLDEARIAAFDPPARFARSLNTEAEYREALAELGG